MMWRLLYSFYRTITLPLQLFALWQRRTENPAFNRRWCERLGKATVSHARRDRPLVWVHAPTESQAHDARTLIKELQRTLPDLEFLVTTTSPDASAVVQQWEPGVLHQYMPFDLVWLHKRMLRHYRPRMILLMEKDIWPNLVYAANRSRVRVLLMNGRMPCAMAKNYRRFAPLTRPAFAGLSQVMAQSPHDQKRFIELGVHPKRVQITGSIEYDLALSGREQKILPRVRSQFESRQFLVAGHLHSGEEDAVVDAFQQLRKHHSDLVLVLHGKRPKRISRRLEVRDIRHVNYDAEMPENAQEAIWLLDSPEHLRVFYSVARIAIVGGSWVDRGAENLIDPVMLGVPTITGPSTYNFSLMARQLQEVGALKSLRARELYGAMDNWLNNDDLRLRAGIAGEQVIRAHQGAKRRMAYRVQKLIG